MLSMKEADRYGKQAKHSKNDETAENSLCCNISLKHLKGAPLCSKSRGEHEEREEQNARSDSTHCFTGDPFYRRAFA